VPRKAKPPTPPVALAARNDLVLPTGPFVLRDAGAFEITPAGLELTRMVAASGGSQRLIASKLEISFTALKNMMARDERIRLEYEAGLAAEEAILVRGLRAAAAAGQYIPALFLLKTRHGYIEGAPPPTTVPNVTIVLPDSRSPTDYLKIINEPKP
jgi:hypothetical protein